MGYRRVGYLEQCYYVIKWWLRHAVFGRSDNDGEGVR